MSFEIVAPAVATDADREAILRPLLHFNEQQAGDAGFSEFALLVRDRLGETAGGLWARVVYDWMFIELLVVPEAARGHGLGTALMGRAEAQARELGLVGIWLDTFSFQARPFYERLGYEVFATLADHPRGSARYFLRKVLLLAGG
jgi:GNAT superfamily N-acetyltransferase